MPFHKGFVATIYDASTNLPLQEYAPTLDRATDTATSYIETKADQSFIVVLRDTTSAFSQGTAVYVDGVYVDNGLTGPGIATERRWFGKRIDHVHVKPFIFRQNTADPSMISDDGRIGSISLILRRCEIGGMAEDQTNRGCVPEDVEPPNIRHISTQEDSLIHRAEYLTPKEIPATLYHVHWIDQHLGPPFLEFKFIYRSRQILISKGIIPGPPEVVETPTTIAQRGKKRKAKNVPKKNKKQNDQPTSSPTTIGSPPSSPPAKGRPPKKFKTTNTRIKVKKENTSEERSPIPSIKSDPPTSPSIEAVQGRLFAPHPGGLQWIASQSANTPAEANIPVDVLRELQELRDEVKRLKRVQYASAQVIPVYSGDNPYTELAGHARMLYESTQETRESWEPYHTAGNAGGDDFPLTGEAFSGDAGVQMKTDHVVE